MSMTVEQLHREALALPPEEREELVIRLLDERASNDEAPPPGPEWMAEIRRRSDEINAGRVELRDPFEFLAELRAKLGLR